MINIPRGTKDILPKESQIWQMIEERLSKLAQSFAVNEIRTPMFEHTELFSRGVGDYTDIVSKEMYTFLDKGGRSITLKAEGTAPVVRSFIENGLDSQGLPQKLYYFADVFRYETPQANRYRQHKQFGAEFFGSPFPEMDAEAIGFAYNALKTVGVKGITLKLNNIGCKSCRPAYNDALVNYYKPLKDKICPDCVQRMEKNPLRLIDCKRCVAISKDAPKLSTFVCPECSTHFEKLKHCLTNVGIPFVVDESIVRGLDYYTKTVFEFTSDALGSQAAVAGGGRYDGLVKQLGGKETCAVGFGMGIERLIALLMAEGGVEIKKRDLLYIACADDSSRDYAQRLAYELRSLGVFAEYDQCGRSLKASIKHADRIMASHLLVLGENELKSGSAEIKNMASGQKLGVNLDNICDFLTKEALSK